MLVSLESIKLTYGHVLCIVCFPVVTEMDLDQMTGGFLGWFDDLKNGFAKLTTEQKLQVLFLMHNKSPPKVLTTVKHKLKNMTTKDFLRLLPPKAVNKILYFVDYQSLVCCAGVSRKWRSLVTENDMLWTQVLMQYFKRSPKELFVEELPPYQLFLSVMRKFHLFKSKQTKLLFPSITEFNPERPDLSSAKNMQSTASGSLVMSYSVKQSQYFFCKYDMSSAGQLLATLSTDYTTDFVATNSFFFSSSISGNWYCFSWESGKEIFKINTKDHGIKKQWFSSYGRACDSCPTLAIFDTHKITTPPDGDSYCSIMMVTSSLDSELGLQCSLKRGKFVCHANPGSNTLINSAVIGCGERSSGPVSCTKHNVVLQLQQDFQVFIYEVQTTLTSELDPTLLCSLKPTTCPDVLPYIFDCYKFCLSLDKKLIGFTCGSEFYWWSIADGVCRHLTISGGYNNLMLVGIGDMFSLMVEVKMLMSLQPILVGTGTGEVVKVFPALEPASASSQQQLYNFITAPLQCSWLSGLLDYDNPVERVIPVFAALYDGGSSFAIWNLVT